MNGCKYKLHGTAELTAQLQIVGCTAGKKIEIIAAGGTPTFTIGEQEPFSRVVFENKNPGSGKEDEAQTKDVEAKATLSGLTYTRDGALCPQGSASFEGTTTIRAYEDEGFTLVTENGHQYE